MFSFVREQIKNNSFNSYPRSFISLNSNPLFDLLLRNSDPFLKKVFDFLSKNSDSFLKFSKRAFQNDLIYHINKITNHQRLYIFLLLIKKILHLTHENDYSKFQKCYKIILIS